AFVGFDETQKTLAGSYVSIDRDGNPFFDQGLVKPEHRKQLAKLLKEDDAGDSALPKPKNPMPESLRRDLAAYRSQIAQVEIARNPAIALDLLIFQVASRMLGEHAVADGPDVLFSRSRTKPNGQEEPTAAIGALAAIE